MNLILAVLSLLGAREDFQRIRNTLAATASEEYDRVAFGFWHAQPFEVIAVLRAALWQHAIGKQGEQFLGNVGGLQIRKRSERFKRRFGCRLFRALRIPERVEFVR